MTEGTQEVTLQLLNMLITAKELSELLDGEIVGDPMVRVHSPSKIEEGTEGTISFLANPKYEPYVYSTKASILLVDRAFSPSQSVDSTLIKVDDVYASIGNLLNKFGEETKEEYEHSSLAFIDGSTEIHQETSIAAFVSIAKNVAIGKGTKIYAHVGIEQGASIGMNCIIYSGVKIYANSVIGDNCIIHSGAVIGSDGFGYSRSKEGKYTKINHVGNVILEDNVEIGANTVVDRGTMGSTIIRKGVKLDNLIQVAHNVEIGEDTVIAAQTGIAGSTKIGQRVVMGGQVGIAGPRKIANDVQIQGQSGVISNVREEGKRLNGYPAIEYTEYLRAYALMRTLPDMKKRIEELERLLKEKSEQ